MVAYIILQKLKVKMFFWVFVQHSFVAAYDDMIYPVVPCHLINFGPLDCEKKSHKNGPILAIEKMVTLLCTTSKKREQWENNRKKQICR